MPQEEQCGLAPRSPLLPCPRAITPTHKLPLPTSGSRGSSHGSFHGMPFPPHPAPLGSGAAHLGQNIHPLCQWLPLPPTHQQTGAGGGGEPEPACEVHRHLERQRTELVQGHSCLGSNPASSWVSSQNVMCLSSCTFMHLQNGLIKEGHSEQAHNQCSYSSHASDPIAPPQSQPPNQGYMRSQSSCEGSDPGQVLGERSSAGPLVSLPVQ